MQRCNSNCNTPKKMGEAEILELHELHYSDLILLSSSSSSASASTSNLTNASSSYSFDDDELLRKMGSVMEALGPMGPGLLAVTGVPNASKLRSQLLPLARKLALLDRDARKRVLKEHNLGSDVPLRNPDRSVSSFAMQLKYAKSPELLAKSSQLHSEESPQDVEQSIGERHNMEYKNLGSAFKELGFCMMELGLFLARVCDKAIGGNGLEQSLLESCAAKGRLIHYHSPLDSLFLKEVEKSKATGKRKGNGKRDQGHFIMNVQKPLQGSELKNSIAHDASSCGIHSNLWQQWHYDYGIFTVLTAPFFLLPSSYSEATETGDLFPESCYDECPSPTGHTCLQICDPNKKRILMVNAPPESFIIQVGESADIISKGKLRATLHTVHRPAKFENLSRATFVVFLQPAWTKTFSISDYPHANSVSDEQQLGEDNDKLSDEIQKIVPPLSSRLKDGMTFAEFSRETTKQYYGGSGLQSNR